MLGLRMLLFSDSRHIPGRRSADTLHGAWEANSLGAFAAPFVWAWKRKFQTQGSRLHDVGKTSVTRAQEPLSAQTTHCG